VSIAPLSKVTLCGLGNDKAGVLEGLQRLGCMHLISLQPPPSEPEAAPPERAEDAYKALRYLMDVRQKRRQVSDPGAFDLDTVVQQVLSSQQRRREAEDRRDFLIQRIKQLTPWGSFRFPPLQELAGYRLWFYCLPLRQMGEVEELGLPWQAIYRDNRFAYLVVIARDEPPHDLMPVPRIRTGAVPLEQLQHELEQAEIALEELNAEHQALSRWVFLLSQNLARAEDQAALRYAAAQTRETEGILIVQGWLPRGELKRVERFGQEWGLAVLGEPPEPDELPPTLFDNPPLVGGGEDLVSFYQTPSYRDWDPSQVVFFSFALFFAMILADAGYALVLGGLVAYYWERMGKSPKGRRFRLLAVWVLGASFIYGVLVGSYFGLSPPPGSLPAGLHVLDLNDFDAMMRISIIVGCLHILLANGAAAYRIGRFPDNARPLGWLVVVTGGMLFWLSWQRYPPLEALGVALLVLGAVLVGLFASRRRVASLKTGLLRLLDGLAALTNITKIFGDVLSYLRLFALGLASASLAITFNHLAAQVQDAFPGLGLLLGILILVLGHGINLGLAIISGFVHGLRLNFIEFFNWGLSEEGYPFRAFAKKEMER
jgi:V/A-type H+-transporting ATPase subunit I